MCSEFISKTAVLLKRLPVLYCAVVPLSAALVALFCVWLGPLMPGSPNVESVTTLTLPVAMVLGIFWGLYVGILGTVDILMDTYEYMFLDDSLWRWAQIAVFFPVGMFIIFMVVAFASIAGASLILV